MPDFIGDPTCKYNALSDYLRCSVNPFGPCDGCSDYVKVREYVPCPPMKPIAPSSVQEMFMFRLEIAALRAWYFISVPLEILQITALLTFGAVIFGGDLPLSKHHLLQNFQLYLRYVSHLYMFYRQFLCIKNAIDPDGIKRTFWQISFYTSAPLLWAMAFAIAIDIFLR